MNTKKLLFAAYGLIILLVPFYLIVQSESILTDGHKHKIRLQGYDPNDPFRGKYLRLSLENNVPCESDVKMGSTGYVLLKKDSLGFSYFSNVQTKRPAHSDYIEAKVIFTYGGNATIDLDNMNKFFINEDQAKDAEEVVEDYTRQAPDKIWLNIRVMDGEARIEDIIVKKMNLNNYLKSGKHRTFKEDIEREYRMQMEKEQREMEKLMRQQIEHVQNAPETGDVEGF